VSITRQEEEEEEEKKEKEMTTCKILMGAVLVRQIWELRINKTSRVTTPFLM
jgi:uncharacterized protein (DUF169 family)